MPRPLPGSAPSRHSRPPRLTASHPRAGGQAAAPAGHPPVLTADVPAYLAARRPRVVVVGDLLLDVWLSGVSDRLSREAPAPVVDVRGRHAVPGGAANTAANLAALGADTVVVGAVGADAAGAELCAALGAAGVDVAGVVAGDGRATLTKTRVVAGDQLVARFDEGGAGRVDGGADGGDGAVRDALAAALAGCDAVVVSDYGQGTAGRAVRDLLADRRDGIPLLVVDAHALADWREVRPDLATPNAAEVAALLGAPLPHGPADRLAAVAQAGDLLREASGAERLVVTLDRDGAVVLDGAPGGPHRTVATPAPETQASGAGDTFCAALTLACAAGLPLTMAADLAQAAADEVVARPATSVCTPADLEARLGAGPGRTMGHDELERRVSEHRAAGRRVVFTNGCFDVLHRGHVTYLDQARRLGDVLVVAVNSDDSVRRLKGPARPVNGHDDRAAMLSALASVDHVTVFEEDSPVDLIARLRPEIYAKGGDYTEAMLPETPVVQGYGGQVRVLGYVSDRSTTTLIERIVATSGRAGDPALDLT